MTTLKTTAKRRTNPRAAIEPAEIYIYGIIGDDWWDSDSMSASRFANELAAIPKNQPINIRINSMGGAVGDGLAIYNLIKTRKNVTAIIDGYALSAASFIPLAASKVIAPISSIWMIHNASGMCWGTAEDMRSEADVLDTHNQVMTDIYIERTGKSAEEIKALLDAETWLTGTEAHDLGFADELMELDDFESNDSGESATAKATRIIPMQFAARATDDTRQKLAEHGWQFGRVAAIATNPPQPIPTPTARPISESIPQEIEMPKELDTPATEPTANSDRLTQMSDEIRELKLRLASAEQAKAEAKEEGDRQQLINQYWQLRATALKLHAVENKLTEEDFNVDFSEDPQIDIENITTMARDEARIDLGMKDRMLRRAAARNPIERVTATADVAKLQNASLKSAELAQPTALGRSQSTRSDRSEAVPLLPDQKTAESPTGQSIDDFAAAIVAKALQIKAK
ncbi:MAG: head maturation protease, ClpP-related [Microcoleus sp.]